jgi:hypothetical protein
MLFNSVQCCFHIFFCVVRIDASWGTEQSTNDDDVSFESSGSSDDGGRTSGTDSPSTVSSTGRNENTKDLLSIFDPLRQAVAAKLGGSNENNQKLLMAAHQNAVITGLLLASEVIRLNHSSPDE